jgi:hypothetical protein
MTRQWRGGEGKLEDADAIIKLRQPVIKVHPFAHPQHMKVLNNFLYIQYGCGVQSVVVYSLNHDTITSFGLHLTLIYKICPPPAQV